MILPGLDPGAGLGIREAGRLHARRSAPCHRRREPRTFAAFGGWSGAINANSDPKVIEAAYGFLSYMNQAAQSNVDVTMGWTGYNPYRISQFEHVDPWVEAGFSRESAENYLGAIGDSLNSPNMASDLRIPGTQRYEGIVLDREMARYLAGEITVEQALEKVYAGLGGDHRGVRPRRAAEALQGLPRHHQLSTEAPDTVSVRSGVIGWPRPGSASPAAVATPSARGTAGWSMDRPPVTAAVHCPP